MDKFFAGCEFVAWVGVLTTAFIVIVSMIFS